MTDAASADDLNSSYRDARSDVAAAIDYLLTEVAASNKGSDTVLTPILGRLLTVARGEEGSDPFKTGDQAHQLTYEQIAWADALAYALTVGNLGAVNFSEQNMRRGLVSLGPNGAYVMRNSDINALIDLSEGTQTRAAELGLGRVREGDVTAAWGLSSSSRRR